MNTDGCLNDKVYVRNINPRLRTLYESVSDLIHIVRWEIDDIKSFCVDNNIQYDEDRIKIIQGILNISYSETIQAMLELAGIRNDRRIDTFEFTDQDVDEPITTTHFYDGWVHEDWGEDGHRLIKERLGHTESIPFFEHEWKMLSDDDKFGIIEDVENDPKSLYNLTYLFKKFEID